MKNAENLIHSFVRGVQSKSQLSFKILIRLACSTVFIKTKDSIDF